MLGAQKSASIFLLLLPFSFLSFLQLFRISTVTFFQKRAGNLRPPFTFNTYCAFAASYSVFQPVSYTHLAVIRYEGLISIFLFSSFTLLYCAFFTPAAYSIPYSCSVCELFYLSFLHFLYRNSQSLKKSPVISKYFFNKTGILA